MTGYLITPHPKNTDNVNNQQRTCAACNGCRKVANDATVCAVSSVIAADAFTAGWAFGFVRASAALARALSSSIRARAMISFGGSSSGKLRAFFLPVSS